MAAHHTHSGKKLVIVHDGEFHADDICATATIAHLHGGIDQIHVIRTRDEAMQATADFVMDTGNVYDPARRRFDHHQTEGAGKRTNGVPYAAFGLVWKEYGAQICEMQGVPALDAQTIADMVDRKLVTPIDADDNGFPISQPLVPGVLQYRFQEFLYAARPTWKEEEAGELHIDAQFMTRVPLAYELIAREIKIARDIFEGQQLVLQAYEATEDKRLIILDGDWPWKEVIGTKPEPLFVVYKQYNKWRAGAVQLPGTFQNKKGFPAAWAGLRDEALAAVSGVPDALFCHRTLFTTAAKSREGAIAMARKAIEA